MRVSTVAMTALAAIAAQSFAEALTRPSPPSETPKNPEEGDRQAKDAPPKPLDPAISPEVVANQQFAGATVETAFLHKFPKNTSPINKAALNAVPAQPDLGTLAPITLPPPLQLTPFSLPKLTKIRKSQVGMDRVADTLVNAEVKRLAPTMQPTKPTAMAAAERSGQTGKPRLLTAVEQAANRQISSLRDIQNHWAQHFIEELVQRGIVKGFGDGTFRPDQPITADEFALMLNKAVPGTANTEQEQWLTAQTTRAEAALRVYQVMMQANRAKGVETAEPSSPLPSRPLPSQPSLVEVAAAKTIQTEKPEKIAAQIPAQPLWSKDHPVAPVVAQVSNFLGLDQKTAALPATPAIAPPVQEYVLGPSDRLRLDVFGVPEYSGEYQVSVGGTLNLPLIGYVSVQGMTVRQASDAVAARYAPLLRRSIITINLLTARPVSVAIAGEIIRPGSYSIPIKEGGKLPTVTQAIQLAGGITRAADLRQVVIRRPQRNGFEQLIQINLWELLQAGNLSQDLPLRDGDAILIPPSQGINLAESPTVAAASFAPDASQPIQVAVVGEIMRPGPYTLTKEVKEGKPIGMPTVTSAIQQAGGITPLANLRQVQIRRSTRAGTEQTINVDLWALLQTGDLKQDLVLQQGDTIVLPTATTPNSQEVLQASAASFSPDSIRVNVVGEVVRPGLIEVTPNTPLNQAILSAGGFTKRARKSSVELIRLNPNGTVSRQQVSIDLAAGINTPNNPMLRSNDIVVVDRSGGAKFSDTLDSILTPIGKLLPFAILGR